MPSAVFPHQWVSPFYIFYIYIFYILVILILTIFPPHSFVPLVALKTHYTT